MVLGIIGMGFAWRYASTIWPVSPFIGEGLVAVATLIWLSLAFAFVYRLLRYPSLVVAEMRHPLTGSFVSLFPATTMLVSIGLAAYSQTRLLADILFLWEHACSCATPHGKVRDYGVASIRQRPPLQGYIYQRSRIISSALWRVGRWVFTIWESCFWRRRIFMAESRTRNSTPYA